jgi:hypothetical protein
MSAVDVLAGTSFAFGPLTFSTKGLGVFCMSDGRCASALIAIACR